MSKAIIDSSVLYGVIGNGKLARHFKHYLTLLDIPYKSWQRDTANTPPSIELEKCTHIGLLISDDAIENFYSQNKFLNGKVVFHCSGALTIPNIYGVHPLMSFSNHLYSLKQYLEVPFIYENDCTFSEILPGLSNPHWPLSAELKPLYHSLCVASGNFSSMIWKDVFALFHDRLGLPSQILQPYLIRTLQNIVEHPQSSITGPIARNDSGTIKKNLDALDGEPLLKIYQAFQNYYPETIARSHERL